MTFEEPTEDRKHEKESAKNLLYWQLKEKKKKKQHIMKK